MLEVERWQADIGNSPQGIPHHPATGPLGPATGHSALSYHWQSIVSITVAMVDGAVETSGGKYLVSWLS